MDNYSCPLSFIMYIKHNMDKNFMEGLYTGKTFYRWNIKKI